MNTPSPNLDPDLSPARVIEEASRLGLSLPAEVADGVCANLRLLRMHHETIQTVLAKDSSC